MSFLWRQDTDIPVPPRCWWWGLCWYEDFNNVRVFTYWPFNLFVALSRWLWAQIAYKLPLRLFKHHGPRTKQQDKDAAANLRDMLRRRKYPDLTSAEALTLAYAADVLERKVL